MSIRDVPNRCEQRQTRSDRKLMKQNAFGETTRLDIGMHTVHTTDGAYGIYRTAPVGQPSNIYLPTIIRMYQLSIYCRSLKDECVCSVRVSKRERERKKAKAKKLKTKKKNTFYTSYEILNVSQSLVAHRFDVFFCPSIFAFFRWIKIICTAQRRRELKKKNCSAARKHRHSSHR